MNMDRLVIFDRIAELGSMRAAARSVHLTQPAVSRSMRLLQEDLGTELFRKHGRGIVLTAAGRALLPRARRLIEDAAAARREVSRAAERDYFSLRIGAVDSVATFLLPDVLAATQSLFPELVVRLNTARSVKLLERVRGDDLDLAVVAWSGEPPDVHAVAVAAYPLQWWAREDRFPALEQVQTTAELSEFPVVEIEAAGGDTGSEPAETLSYARASNVATVKALVLAGFGAGDFVDFMLQPAERRLLVHANIPHDPDCNLYVATSPGFLDSAERHVRDAFVEALRDRATQT